MLNKNNADPETGRVNVGRWVNTFVNPATTHTAVPRWFTPFGTGENAAQKNRMLLHVLGLMTAVGGGAYLARTLGVRSGESENEKFQKKLDSLTRAQRPDPAKALIAEKTSSEKKAGVFLPWTGVGDELAHWSYAIPALAAILAGVGGYAMADKKFDEREARKLDEAIGDAEKRYGESNMARLMAARGVEKEGAYDQESDPGIFNKMNAILLAVMAASGYVGYGLGDWYVKKTDPVRERRKALLKELENRFRIDQPPTLMRNLDPELRNKIDASAKSRASAKLSPPATGMGTSVEPMAI